MRVDIFCESGAKYGLGHFYRCVKLIALCAKTKQINAITLHNRGDFTPPPLAQLLGEVMPQYVSYECKNYEWLSTQPQMLDIAIVDSYEAQEWFYYRLKSQSKALICLDDTLRDVYPPQSYILNPTPHIQEHFAHKNYHLWCGEDYIIPPILLPQSPIALKNTQDCAPCCNIFVNFGGVDKDNLTQEILHHLSHLLTSSALTHCHFHIILGNGYAHHLFLEPHLHAHISIYRHLCPQDFLAKAKECDYAISAGGGSMLELILLKVPSIIIESAPNQHLHITQWAKKGAIATAKNPLDALYILQSWCEHTLHNHTFSYEDNASSLALAFNDVSLDSIQNTLHSLSLGALLPQALCTLFAQVNDMTYTQSHTQNTQADSLLALPFTHLNQEQSEIVLSMRNHKDVARWMYATHINPSSHSAFLQELQNNSSKQYWLFKDNDEYIGVGSLTRINPNHKHAFIGIYANPLCTQDNKGARILAFLESFATHHLALHTLHLEVLSHNERALKFYEKNGYTREGVLHHFILHKDGEQRRYYDVILMYKECQ
ncbi:MAG: UDP-4-amino-4,6-dideoxy-N-acetyl-beta-L-altrosamine N-acetyltransferase [Helicobacter sp.]|uniref:UDP-4-amino-4, 6-dideoxy-N-acetyl-beta-L-altrosamine N-acetyltransferase n=1 Tax=Helicobacter sp. TaxID=218 RepID=UPI0025BE30D0|nr:UDP-4-amino-4,6-dideoxy-N-acetyl-beta-L-altrosamine N-acetyltransferase [Helicobacter sp.]MCH5313594.1 UDP-4-amino-4,6-dideoxy-N-acetyl-beta-L-altrosamine N-acetyltransferase [Helicobacter sp.]